MENIDDKTSKDTENDETIDLKFISDILIKEIQISSLQDLSPRTYKKIAKMINVLSSQNYEGIESNIRDEMIRLLQESTKLLIKIRNEKLNDKEYNDEYFPAISSTNDYSKLTDEEKYILEGEINTHTRKDSIIHATSNGSEKILDIFSQIVRARKIIVRFLEPIEQFIGVDMINYGPFSKEDVAILPYENARSLIENKEAVEIYDLQYKIKET